MSNDNNYLPYGSAGTDEEIIIEDLAPPLTMAEAARTARKFINGLPDDIIDIDLGSGL